MPHDARSRQLDKKNRQVMLEMPPKLWMPIFINHARKKVYGLDRSPDTQMLFEEMEARCNVLCALPSKVITDSWSGSHGTSIQKTVWAMSAKHSLLSLARVVLLHHFDIGDVVHHLVSHLRTVTVNAAFVDSARLV